MAVALQVAFRGHGIQLPSPTIVPIISQQTFVSQANIFVTLLDDSGIS